MSSYDRSVELEASIENLLTSLQHHDADKCEGSRLWSEVCQVAARGIAESSILRRDGALHCLYRQLRTPGVCCHCGSTFAADSTGELLQTLEHLASCVDGAREFRAYGGHQVLLKLLEDEDASVAVDEMLGGEFGRACTQALCPFPSLSKGILDEDEVYRSPLTSYDFMEDGYDSAEQPTPSWRVYIRTIPETQESQFTVGYMMWSAAVILGRWIHRHQSLFQGHSIHEVGAGLGLTGLAAANIPDTTVTLSDFNPQVVENLDFNRLLNQHSELNKAIDVMLLDWSIAPKTTGTGQGEGLFDGNGQLVAPAVDYVIGSDIICQTSDARMLVDVMKYLIKPSGVGIICLPVPSNRFGTEAFPVDAQKAGFRVSTTLIKDPTLFEGLEEATYFKWNIHVVARESALGFEDCVSAAKQS